MGTKLEAEGRIFLSDVTKAYDLPTELVSGVVTSAVGSLIKGTALSRLEPPLMCAALYCQASSTGRTQG